MVEEIDAPTWIRDLAAEIATLPSFMRPTVSPDGKRIACYHTATGQPELLVIDRRSGVRTQWSDGEMPQQTFWPPHWSSGGERIYYPHNASGDEQNDVYAIYPDDDVEPIVETEGMTNLRAVGPDGRRLLVGSNHDGGMDVYAASLPSGELTRLTDADSPVWTSILSPDGTLVAFPGGPNDAASGGFCDESSDVTIVDCNGRVRETIDTGTTNGTVAPADWGPDGERLFVGDDSTNLDRCGVYDRSSESIRWLGPGEYVEEPECFLPGGGRVLATRTRGTSVIPVVYDLHSSVGRELQLDGGVTDFGYRTTSIIDETRILLTHEMADRRRRLLEYDLSTDDVTVRLAAEYGTFDPGGFVSPTTFTIESDGVVTTPAAALEVEPGECLDIDCLLYDAGERPSPLVVKVHGGPHQADQREFERITQFLVHCGYAVLHVNYRGSSGRGRTFQRALYGDWGGAEQGDIALATEHVLNEHSWIDPDRIAVFGVSYGGYSASWQLVQYPDLYAAGIAWVPMTDLVDMYENTVPQFRTGFLQRHLGTPDSEPEVYRERSPISHVEHLDAPVLLLHGASDPRTPVSQARRFKDAIDRTQGEQLVEYHEFDNVGHGSGDADTQERILYLVATFLNRHLGGETCCAEGETEAGRR